jgi:hypothetical protein
VQLARSVFAGRQRVVPSAHVINRGDAPVSVPVELRIDNRVQQVRPVQVAAHGTATVQFDAMFTSTAAGDVRVTAGDDVPADDIAYFTTDAQSAPAVRLVAGSAESAFYFENALAAGDEGAFAVRRADPRLSAGDLADGAVVVYLDAQLPGGDAAERLTEFVRQGGGLLIAGIGNLRGELAPVQNGSAVDRTQSPATLVAIDATHPVFDAFRASGAEAFAAARITRHARTEPVADATVIARFDDGSPALVEKRLGRGRILYFASSFARGAGDLVLQPAFVPFAQQLIRHAAAGAHVARAYTVGQVIDVNSFAPADQDAVVITPGRDRVRYAPAERARTLRIAEPGIYQIRSTGAGARTQLIAANVDVVESDMSALDAALFADAIEPGSANAGAAGIAPLLPADREQRQSVWWYLLFIAFALLAIETLIGNRISTAWRT